MWTRLRDLLRTRAVFDVGAGTLAQAAQAGAAMVTAILVARGLGRDLTGLHALAASVGAMVLTLADLGVGQTALRYASQAHQRGDREAFADAFAFALGRRALVLVALTVVVWAGADVLAVRAWARPELAALVRISVLSALAAVLAPLPVLYFQSIGRFGAAAAVSVIQGIVTVSLVAGLRLAGMLSVAGVLFAAVVAALVQAATVFAIPRLVRADVWRALRRPRTEVHRDRDAFAFWLMLSALAVGLTQRLDLWLVGALLDGGAAGLYATATRTALPLAMVLGAITSALWPRVAAADPIATLRLLRKAFGLGAMAAAGGIVYALLAPAVMPLLFGDDFATGGIVATVLSIRFCFALLTNPVALVGYNFQLVRFYAAVNVVQLVAMAALDAILLPRYGALGAAMALLATDGLGFVLTAAAVWPNVRRLSTEPA